jgi:hypothetical protein
MTTFVDANFIPPFIFHLNKIMKKQLLVYILLTSSIPFNSWAQKNLLNEKKIGESQTSSPTLNDQIDTLSARKIKYYHVEEIYEMKSGGHKTIYNVSDYRLIRTYDLGPNNKRIITPVYWDQIAETLKKSDPSKKIKNPVQLAIANKSKKTAPFDLVSKDKNIIIPAVSEKDKPNETSIKLSSLNRLENSDQLAIAVTSKKADLSDLELGLKSTIAPALDQKEKLDENEHKLDTSNKTENSTPLAIIDAPKKSDNPAYIDIIKTYEGVVEKGYETLEILKKLANSLYFNNQLEKAEKYYAKLFNKTTDLEPEYYFRYSVALKSTGHIEKANEYLKKFNQLSGNSSR